MEIKIKQKKSKAIILADRFSSLTKHTAELVFPDYRNGILSKPDSEKWGEIKKYIYQFAHSALYINQQNGWQVVAYFVLSFSSFIQLALSLLFLDPKYYSIPNVTANTAEINPFVIGVTVITTAFVLPVIVYWWYEIFTDKRYLLWHKIVIFILIIISLCSFANQIDLKAKLYDWLNLDNHILAVFVILIFPAISFLLSICVDLILSGYYLLRLVLSGIDSLHNPLPFKEIRKLLQEDIPSYEETKAWRFTDLSGSELANLHRWAITNRESTEKRIIPLSIGLGLFGIITFSDTIRTIADKSIAWFLGTLTTFINAPFSLPLQTTLLNLSILLVFLVFIGSFTRSLLSLFVNISVQNVIIETCVIAMQSKKKEK